MVVLRRVINSKKAFYALVPVVVNAVGAFADVDVTQPAILVLDAAFAMLLLAQMVIDAVQGSPSDAAIVVKTSKK